MTRPGIVRADTIDLQSQNSPSAQDHSRKPHSSQPSTAPHQAAELRHVQEERHSEEEILSHAWQSANGLSDEPPTDDDDDDDNDAMRQQQGQKGGGQQAQHEADADDTDLDDDMMDKISSSPSISDGGYSYFSSHGYGTARRTPPLQTATAVHVLGTPNALWPKRSSSLYTPTPPRHASSGTARVTNTPASSTAMSSPRDVYGGDNDHSCQVSSSPFLTTPTHLPAGRPASPFPFRTGLARRNVHRPGTPLAEVVDVESEASSSPFIESPEHFPLHYTHNKINTRYNHSHSHSHSNSNSNSSGCSSSRIEGPSGHHTGIVIEDVKDGIGEEIGMRGGDGACVEGWEEVDNNEVRPEVPPKDDVPVHQPTRFYSQQQKLVKSASDIAFEADLLPVNDPMLSDDVFFDCKENIAKTTGSTTSPTTDVNAADDNEEEEDEGWETESETQYSDDSFRSDDYTGPGCTSDCDLSCSCSPAPATANDCNDNDHDRFIDSGWGGECLRETEDIDFEFVYALHTFVATVEGQANAQKGDTMVLLDDSNSYWWLVRVVKDSTIGYLPAEHIETPTERLARLNKHRNVDLSQTMLGDTTEKTKNPLKKAMRRRNAKTVTFTSPTYIEPSEYEYTTDDDSGDDESLTNGNPGGQVEQSKAQATTDVNGKDEISTVAPLKVRDKKRDGSPEKGDGEDDDRRRKIDESRTSDEQFDREFTASNAKQSKHGTPRNTDSFFRDESIETRKITLTPNILRDDSSGSTGGKNSMERGPSLELLEKDPKPVKAGKKDKKPGMLSGLFKRKDKKGKGDDASSSRSGKLSGETLRESPTSEESSPIERPGTSEGPLQRQGSKGKLQKSPPAAQESPLAPAPLVTTQKKPSTDSMTNVSANSSAQSSPRSGSPVTVVSASSDQNLQKQSSLRARAQESISSKLRTNVHPEPEETKPAKVKRAKTREALDIDSSPDEESKDPFADTEVIPPSQVQAQERLAPPPGPGKLGAMSSTERLSESPVHISSAEAEEPPALVGDSSSSEGDELTSLRSSPDPLEGGVREKASLDSITAPTTSTPQPTKAAPPPPNRDPPPQPSSVNRSLSPARNNSTSTTSTTLSPSSPSPVWSDAHLRAYMDTTEDIRDLLVVVHDTRGVVPVGADHPLMEGLFAEERGKVRELDLKLDGLLGGWLARKRGMSPAPNGRGISPAGAGRGTPTVAGR